jgi:chromosomal replication initiation ATPase DnaA
MNYTTDTTLCIVVEYNANTTNLDKMQHLLADVSEVTGLSITQIRKRTRHRELVLARSLFCYIAHYHFRFTIVSIGKFLTCHHATVVNSCKIVTTAFGNRDPLSKHITDNYHKLLKML